MGLFELTMSLLAGLYLSAVPVRVRTRYPGLFSLHAIPLRSFSVRNLAPQHNERGGR